MSELIEIDPELAREAWKRGLLSYKLYPHQIDIYEAFWNAIKDEEVLKYTANISRRFGKSFIICLIAFEYAIRFPKSRIKVACPTQGQMSKIVDEVVMGCLLNDCPKDFRPRYRHGKFTFENGSFVQLAGSDMGNADRLRGTSSNLNFIDEAGFVSSLKYLISSVLMPTQIKTGGTMVICSTPSKSTDHDFTQICAEAQADGTYMCRTIDDDPSMTPEIRSRYAKEYGGEDTTEFKREYLCEFITDSDIHVIKEWDTGGMTCVPERDENYSWYHKYVAMDIGGADNTAVLFGYYDFKLATLVIEDEYTMTGNDMTMDVLGAEVVRREAEMWGECKSPHQTSGFAHDKVYRRISDNNNIFLTNTLQRIGGVNFTRTGKNSLEAMVHKVKLLTRKGQLRVNKRCLMTIGCLEAAYWNGAHTSFAKSKKYSHFDHLAALIYMVHNLDTQTNPLPAMYIDPYTHYAPAGTSYNSEHQKLANAILGRKSK